MNTMWKVSKHIAAANQIWFKNLIKRIVHAWRTENGVDLNANGKMGRKKKRSTRWRGKRRQKWNAKAFVKRISRLVKLHTILYYYYEFVYTEHNTHMYNFGDTMWWECKISLSILPMSLCVCVRACVCWYGIPFGCLFTPFYLPKANNHLCCSMCAHISVCVCVRVYFCLCLCECVCESNKWNPAALCLSLR